MNTKDKLYKQITDAAGNVFYTYIAHWIIVNRLKGRYRNIKIAQIILTAMSTGGFLTSIIAGIAWLSWLGGLTSAIALALNLYMLNFDLPDDIRKHTDAANEIWDIRENYRSLIVDFNDMTIETIRTKREELLSKTSDVYKKYPGTDEKSFEKAQRRIPNYTFVENESEKLLL